MNITLYKTASENNRVNKYLTSNISKTGELRAGSNVVNPSILIHADNLTKYNYVYIKEFNRYYYIEEMKQVRTGIWELELHVDVLYTYKEQLKQLNCIVEKQEGSSITDDNYNDGSFRVKENTFCEQAVFEEGFNDAANLILVVCGAMEEGVLPS